MIFDKAMLSSLDDTEFDYVEIPEASRPGDTEVPKIRVRSMTGDQRAKVRARLKREEGGAVAGDWNAMVCALGMVDDAGALLFSTEPEGTQVMGKKHPEIVERIAAKILDLSRMTKAMREDAEKKRMTTTNDSGSSSPEPSLQDSGSTSTA